MYAIHTYGEQGGELPTVLNDIQSVVYPFRLWVNVTLSLAVCLVTGCRSPMEEVLASTPHWEKQAQSFAARNMGDDVGLKREPFPNLDNPLHVEIWTALRKTGNIGDGFGSICTYNPDPKRGCYLLSMSQISGHHVVSYFYIPSGGWVIDANEQTGASYYPGDRKATVQNIKTFVAYLSILLGYEAFAVERADDIPHSEFQRDNPQMSFEDFLSSKGLTISPPQILQKDSETEYRECNLFVYCPCGGQVYRYEVRCRNGQIEAVKSFLVASEVGDCWYIM